MLQKKLLDKVNFWLDPKAVPARVALGVTTLLTMSTQVKNIIFTMSTNPISFTAPGSDGDDLELDMATATVAVGKLEVAAVLL